MIYYNESIYYLQIKTTHLMYKWVPMPKRHAIISARKYVNKIS